MSTEDKDNLQDNLDQLQAKVQQVIDEIPAAIERGKLFEYSRKLLLATIGAVALAQDEMESLVEKLVERGEIAERDGKELVQKLGERGKEVAEKSKEKWQQKFAQRTAATTPPEAEATPAQPTTYDVQVLLQKISELSAKVDALTQKPAPEPEVATEE